MKKFTIFVISFLILCGISFAYDNNDVLKEMKNTLKNESIYNYNIDWDNEEYPSITGYLDSLNDKYAEYYSNEDVKYLYEDLEGEYSGIGAYIGDLGKGEFIITSIVSGSPAEEAGLHAGDVLFKIDNHVIVDNNTLNEISSWIKGDNNTNVSISVKRGDELLKFDIKRKIVALENVKYEILGGGICYMDINQFNGNTLSQFEDGIEYFHKNGCEIYMFDLRDNVGGEFDTVVNMLNYFVDKDKTIVEMKYNNYVQDFVADDGVKKLNKDTIILLSNGYSASASEIFLGTIKDYVKNSIIIGSKTYGKGTAQSLVQNKDGSVLKYTVAKWYTGKTKTNVDGIGITPDIILGEDSIKGLIEKIKK